MENYQATKIECWQGRKDSEQVERIFQQIECLDLSKQIELPHSGIVLLGFCCEAGVIRNQGRAGAKEGPAAFRKVFANLPACSSHKLYDGGDIVCIGDNLLQAQQALGNIIAMLYQNNLQVIVIGGGHEIAYGHYLGIDSLCGDKKLGIINFDAHYDLRPLIDEQYGSSGTPFKQIADHRGAENFSYLCVGIQKTANTASLFETAKQLNVQTIFADQVHRDITNSTQQVQHFANTHELLYVTVCLDVFSQAVAPGVSAPQANGLWPEQVLVMLEQLIGLNKPLFFDIAELSPQHDQNNMTARLAAHLAHYFIEETLELGVVSIGTSSLSVSE